MKKVILYVFIFFYLIPFIMFISFGFFISFTYPNLLPNEFTFKYLKLLINDKLVLQGLINSVIIGILTSSITTIVSLLFARAITKYDFKLKKHLSYVFSLPLFIPAIIIFTVIHQSTIRLNLDGSILGLVLANTSICVPYSIIILKEALEKIDLNYEYVCKTLGASTMDIWKKVLLPMLSKAIRVSLSMCFLISFSEYLSGAFLGGGIISLPMVVYPYLSSGDLNRAAILGIMFLVINMMIFLLIHKVAFKKRKGDINDITIKRY